MRSKCVMQRAFEESVVNVADKPSEALKHWKKSEQSVWVQNFLLLVSLAGSKVTWYTRDRRFHMIEVLSAVSGEPVAVVNAQEFEGQPVQVLKKCLEAQTGLPRFRQRLLSAGGEEITGNSISLSHDLQLLLLEYLPPDAEQDEKLAVACSDNNAEEVEKLLCQPRNPNAKIRSDGRTALHCAAENGNLDCARLLLEAGAEKGVKAKGKAPLHLAASNGHTEMVRVLLESGAEKDATERYGATPLHLAANKGRSEVVRVLLDSGAAKDQVTDDGRTPLHIAAEFGRLEVARLLLDAGAEIEQPTADEHGMTPLHWAAYGGHLKVVRLLLEAGCDKRKTSKPFDETPLQLALSVGHGEVASLLAEWRWAHRAHNLTRFLRRF